MNLKTPGKSVKYECCDLTRRQVAPLTLAIGGVLGAGAVQANTIEVNTLQGGFAVDVCTLREAISAANTGGAFNGCPAPDGPNPTIIFSSGLSGTIEEESSLEITASVAIDGDGRITVENTGSGAVIIATDTVGSLEIDGLEITGGSGSLGGGIQSQADDLDIRNSVITGNTASSAGGGIYHDSGPGGTVYLIDNDISDNASYYGGGLLLSKEGSGAISITDNEFNENYAIYAGGAVFLGVENNNNLYFKYNTVSDNLVYSGPGGGLITFINGGSDSEIKYNTFSGNEASGDGGGMYIMASDHDVQASGNVMFINDAGQRGGAIYADLQGGSFAARELYLGINTSGEGGSGMHFNGDNTGQLALSEAEIRYNINEDGFGGGLRVTGTLDEIAIEYSDFRWNEGVGGGAISFAMSSSVDTEVTVDSSEISYSQNSNGQGGGIYAFLGSGSELIVSNSTFSNNSGAFRGGGIFHRGSGSELQVQYSTVVYNAANHESGGIYGRSDCEISNTVMANLADSVQDDTGDDCLVSHSLIRGAANSDYVDGGGNITGVDPNLMPLADHGGIGTRTHRPFPASPVVDAGQDQGDTPSYDQRGDGFPRIVGAGLDMGAHELQATGDEVFNDRFEQD